MGQEFWNAGLYSDWETNIPDGSETPKEDGPMEYLQPPNYIFCWLPILFLFYIGLNSRNLHK